MLQRIQTRSRHGPGGNDPACIWAPCTHSGLRVLKHEGDHGGRWSLRATSQALPLTAKPGYTRSALATSYLHQQMPTITPAACSLLMLICLRLVLLSSARLLAMARTQLVSSAAQITAQIIVAKTTLDSCCTGCAFTATACRFSYACLQELSTFRGFSCTHSLPSDCYAGSLRPGSLCRLLPYGVRWACQLALSIASCSPPATVQANISVLHPWLQCYPPGLAACNRCPEGQLAHGAPACSDVPLQPYTLLRCTHAPSTLGPRSRLPRRGALGKTTTLARSAELHRPLTACARMASCEALTMNFTTSSDE